MNDRISFSCPHCTSRLRASVRFVGQAFLCPKCGRQLVVPRQVADEEAPILIEDDGGPHPHRGGRWNSS